MAETTLVKPITEIRQAGFDDLNVREAADNTGVNKSKLIGFFTKKDFASIPGSIIAGLNNLFDLGSSTKKWRNIYLGGGIKLSETTPATMGIATLVAGTVTVSSTKTTASSRIFLSHQATGGTLGHLYVSARSAGVSFTITSTSATDTSTVCWLIVEPI